VRLLGSTLILNLENLPERMLKPHMLLTMRLMQSMARLMQEFIG